MRSAGSLSGFSGHWKMANPANVRPDSASLRAIDRSSAADGSAGSCLYASAMTLECTHPWSRHRHQDRGVPIGLCLLSICNTSTAQAREEQVSGGRRH